MELKSRDIIYKDIFFIKDLLNYNIKNSSYNLSTFQKTDEDIKYWYEEHLNAYPILVATINEEKVGYISLSKFRNSEGYSKTAEVSIYVSDNFKNKGIGKFLMNEIEIKAKEYGFHTLISVITSNNLVSISLHEKLGYNFNGKLSQVGFKADTYYDVVFMTKTV